MIPTELKTAISNNQLIIFVGAGLSYNLININGQHLKGWTNLVEQILIDLKKKGHDVECLIPLLSKYDPIKILDLIEFDKTIPKKDIYGFIKDFLDLSDENNYELHKKIYKLSKKIRLNKSKKTSTFNKC
jgi:flagellar motor component MotA